MRTHLDELDAARILAGWIEKSDVSADETLAYLAFHVHHDEAVITRASERGADISTVGIHAHALRKKVENALGLSDDS